MGREINVSWKFHAPWNPISYFFKFSWPWKFFHGSWILILWISWQIHAPLNPILLYLKVFHGHESVFHGSWIILLQISWQIHGFEKGHEKENLHFHGHEKWVHGFLINLLMGFSWNCNWSKAIGTDWKISNFPELAYWVTTSLHNWIMVQMLHAAMVG